MGALTTFLYRKLCRRSSAMLVIAVASAPFVERFIDWASLEIFHSYNRGLLWDDVKHKYEKKPEAM